MLTVTYVEHDGTVHTVSAEPGVSLMKIAVDNLVPGISADCGGACRCATCHCFIEEPWLNQVNAMSEDEQVMLEGVDGRPNSRLSCQITMRPELDGIRVLLPESQ